MISLTIDEWKIVLNALLSSTYNNLNGQTVLGIAQLINKVNNEIQSHESNKEEK